MAYPCPRCGQPLQRKASTTAAVAGGLVGGLLAAAFGGFQCRACGPVDKSLLSPQVRRKMLMGSILMILIALGILIGVILLLPHIAPQHP